MLTKEEILTEIERLRTEIANAPEGSIRLPDLTVALVMHYELYVELTLAEWDGQKRRAA